MRGRPFTEFDREGNAVAILNKAAAQLLFGNDNPIGRRIGSGRQGPANMEVVGVVENAKYLSVREAPIPTVYVPFRDGSPMTLHVKTRADPQSALRVIEQELKALDPTLPLFQVQTIEARVDDALRQERLVATLATILERLGDADSRGRHLRPDQLLGCSTNARDRDTDRGRCRTASDTVDGPRASVRARAARNRRRSSDASARPRRRQFLYGVTPGHPAILAGVLTVVTVVGLSAGSVPAGNAARTDAWNALRSD